MDYNYIGSTDSEGKFFISNMEKLRSDLKRFPNQRFCLTDKDPR